MGLSARASVHRYTTVSLTIPGITGKIIDDTVTMPLSEAKSAYYALRDLLIAEGVLEK